LEEQVRLGVGAVGRSRDKEKGGVEGKKEEVRTDTWVDLGFEKDEMGFLRGFSGRINQGEICGGFGYSTK